MTLRKVALGLAVFLVVGCGERNAPDHEKVLRRAADRADAEKTVRGEVRVDLKSKSEGNLEMVGTGTSTVTGNRLRFRYRYSRLPGFEGGLDADLIIVGKRAWMGGAQIEEALPAGKRWLRLSDPTLGTDSLTFSQTFELMRETGGIKDLGRERVRGRPGRHYKGKMDVEAAAEAMREKGADSPAVKRLEDSSIEEIPLDVWIGDDGRPARLEIQMAFEGERVAMTFDILSWGTEVKADPPPAREVIDESELEE